jgi:hypothetical protein
MTAKRKRKRPMRKGRISLIGTLTRLGYEVVNMADKADREIEYIIVWPCTKPILYKIASAVETINRFVNMETPDPKCCRCCRR